MPVKKVKVRKSCNTNNTAFYSKFLNYGFKEERKYRGGATERGGKMVDGFVVCQ